MKVAINLEKDRQDVSVGRDTIETQAQIIVSDRFCAGLIKIPPMRFARQTK